MDHERESTTGTTAGARDHARAQSGSRVRFQRHLPPRDAAGRSDARGTGVVLWDETVEGGNYALRRLPRGTRLELADPDGDTCVQLLVWNAEERSERCSVADTVKVQWNAYLEAGRIILSDMGRVMMSIVTDTSSGHDTFNAVSNERSNASKYGSGGAHGAHPNARDRFAVAVSKAGMERRDIPPAFNLFKAVRVADDGSFTWPDAAPEPGAVVELRCEMDVIVAVTVTPHVLDPRPEYVVSPLEVTAWSGEPTPADDPIRNSTPEVRRAFENTDDWLLEHRGPSMIEEVSQ